MFPIYHSSAPSGEVMVKNIVKLTVKYPFEISSTASVDTTSFNLILYFTGVVEKVENTLDWLGTQANPAVSSETVIIFFQSSIWFPSLS